MAARQRALESAAISREHSFVLMHGWASVFEGWALAELGDPDSGIPVMREGLARARTNGSSLFLPVLFGVLTEAQLKCGRVSEARTTLAEALALAARTGDQVSLSELDRLAGELCLIDGADVRAEQHLRVALERTRVQGAKLLELRTAVSLSRSWLASGKRAEAHDLLTRARVPTSAHFCRRFRNDGMGGQRRRDVRVARCRQHRGAGFEFGRGELRDGQGDHARSHATSFSRRKLHRHSIQLE